MKENLQLSAMKLGLSWMILHMRLSWWRSSVRRNFVFCEIFISFCKKPQCKHPKSNMLLKKCDPLINGIFLGWLIILSPTVSAFGTVDSNYLSTPAACYTGFSFITACWLLSHGCCDFKVYGAWLKFSLNWKKMQLLTHRLNPVKSDRIKNWNLCCDVFEGGTKEASMLVHLGHTGSVARSRPAWSPDSVESNSWGILSHWG